MGSSVCNIRLTFCIHNINQFIVSYIRIGRSFKKFHSELEELGFNFGKKSKNRKINPDLSVAKLTDNNLTVASDEDYIDILRRNDNQEGKKRKSVSFTDELSDD